MNVEIRDELFRTVVGEGIALERLATGFEFTEGPIGHRREKHLTFSDMPGDGVHLTKQCEATWDL